MKHLLLIIPLSLSLSHCAIFFPKKTVDAPLLNFYKTSPPPHTKVSLALTEEARNLMSEDQNALAIEKLNKALALDPYNPFAYYFLGRLHYKNLRYEKSLEFCAKARQLAQEFPFWKAQSYLLTGLNWKAMGQTKKAEFHFKKAQSIFPEIDLSEAD